jgi:hypothetical protein
LPLGTTGVTIPAGRAHPPVHTNFIPASWRIPTTVKNKGVGEFEEREAAIKNKFKKKESLES